MTTDNLNDYLDGNPLGTLLVDDRSTLTYWMSKYNEQRRIAFFYRLLFYFMAGIAGGLVWRMV